MANVTIPNLPQVTATTDLDILVITNSGETTTSKITKSDFLSDVGGGNLVEGTGLNALSTTGNESRASQQDAIFIAQPNKTTGSGQASGLASLVISPLGEAQATGAYSINISKGGTSGGNTSTIVGGSGNSNYNDNGSIFGGTGNDLKNLGSINGIYGGANNTMFNGYNSVIVGGSGNESRGSSNFENIIACEQVKTNTTNNSAHVNVFGSSSSAIAVDRGDAVLVGAQNSGINDNGTDSNYLGKIDVYRSGIYSSANSFIKGVNGVDTIGVGIYNSNAVLVDQKDYVVVLGVNGYTADTSNVVVVPSMIINDYSSYNFADDTAAAAGGVVLGQVYHNSGALRVRIS